MFGAVSFITQTGDSDEIVLCIDKTGSTLRAVTVRFGLVSLFNGISTFVGYLMPKLFSEKNSSGTI